MHTCLTVYCWLVPLHSPLVFCGHTTSRALTSPMPSSTPHPATPRASAAASLFVYKCVGWVKGMGLARSFTKPITSPMFASRLTHLKQRPRLSWWCRVRRFAANPLVLSSCPVHTKGETHAAAGYGGAATGQTHSGKGCSTPSDSHSLWFARQAKVNELERRQAGARALRGDCGRLTRR